MTNDTRTDSEGVTGDDEPIQTEEGVNISGDQAEPVDMSEPSADSVFDGVDEAFAVDLDDDQADPSGGESQLQEEFNELNDRHLRLAAEFANYRRRQEAEREETWARAQVDFVRKFLDGLDDLQRVALLDPADEAVTVEAIVEGIDLVERKFLRALEEAGVKTLNPVGEVFNPETMEAMMRVSTDSRELDDHVADVFSKGFMLRKHLIRAARVSVLKAE